MLVAPPGAGKTTVTPLALLDEAWARGGKLIVLEPRRAGRPRRRRANGRDTLGEPVGETVGYRVRLDVAGLGAHPDRGGHRGRLHPDDPGRSGLEGVAAVLFDEFHERSLDADLGLAFARDSQPCCGPTCGWW